MKQRKSYIERNGDERQRKPRGHGVAAKARKKAEHLKNIYNPQIKPVVIQSRMGCLVQPYKPRQCHALEANTGHYDEVYHTYNEYVGFTIPFNGTSCYVTYNRDYNFIRRALPDYTVEKAPYTPWRWIRDPIHLVGVKEFKPAQSELITQIDQSIESKKERLWFIHLQTSGGKTLLATYYATRFKMKTMILCFSDNILRQWEETFRTRTDIDPQRIIRLRGPIMDQLLAGRIPVDRWDIYVATPTLLDRWANRRMDYIHLKDFFETVGIGFLIFDEAHRHVSSIVRLSAVVNPKYQMYLSADFAQGEFNKEYQFRNVFRNVPVLEPSSDLRRSMKYTKVVVVDFNTHPSGTESEAIFNRYGYAAELYMRYQFKKKIIQGLIMHLVGTFPNKEKNYRMLILFENIEHVIEIYSKLVEVFPEYEIGLFYGDIPQDQKLYVKDNSDIIVATYGSFSTGLDTENIKYVVSCNQCNKVQDNQAAGRTRPLADGTDAVYFMLVDMGFSYCKDKLKKRLEYLQETKSKDDRAYHYTYNPQLHLGERGVTMDAEQIPSNDGDPDEHP